MISKNNLEQKFKILTEKDIKADAKHSFYFELNRTLSRLDSDNLPRFITVKPRVESLLQEVQEELKQQGIVSLIVLDPDDSSFRLHILLRD